MTYRLSETDVQQFHQDGYVIIRTFFAKDEIEKLYSIAIGDEVIKHNATNVKDNQGKNSKLTLWFTPGEDVYSMMLRS